MNLYTTPEGVRAALDRSGAIRRDGGLVVTDPERFRLAVVDDLVRTAVFGGEARPEARRSIREAAASLSILPASILPLYEARGRGEISGFTVPAVNIRALAYDTARAAFRAARRLSAGALVFEIARSEIGYTDQRPAEYAAVVLSAAIREGWSAPVFLQGDHFQTNPKKMKTDPAREIKAIEDLILEALAADFHQIDIDTSTLVDLSKRSLEDQQRPNFESCARLARFIREHQPEGVEISIGGEIGEVGKENSTPEEFRAFMAGFEKGIAGIKGISKVSVQTGSSHGGQVAPDGRLKRMSVDFGALETIGRIAREEHGMAGAVQHGASTLPEEDFGQFPLHETAEIHLATGFQNLIYDHPAFPAPLRQTIYRWLTDNAGGERKREETPEQFLYKTRKKALGPFKEAFWNLPEGARRKIGESLEEKFLFLFEKLRAGGTAALIEKYVRPVRIDEREMAGAFVRDDEAGD
jgi:fructose/tagatose bisphosphate aldolase